MKVLLINTVNLEANGISTFIINVASQLVKKYIDVTILTPNKVNDDLLITLKDQDIHLKQIPGRMSNPIKYFNSLKAYLSSEKFDVVHVNGSSTTMAIELFAAKLAGVNKRIAHSHNTETEHYIINKLLRPLFEISITDRLACSEAAGKWLFNNKQFSIIMNGISLNNYKFSEDQRKKYRQKLNVKSNEILLGHVGYFNYQKNQIFLVKLLKELPTNYKLVLIGEGKELNNVKTKAKTLNLTNRIIFTGTVNNVQDYLNAMDIFLLPSNFEGQPFVLVEASANGLNCVVSDKVSKENDLVNNLSFVNLSNVKKWLTVIKSSNVNGSKRIINSNKYCWELSNKGYDSNDISKLMKVYRSKND